MKNSRPSLNALRTTLAVSTLALTTWAAQAAVVNYTGLVDSGPLLGSVFSGSFAYADPAAGFDGAVDLSAFTLNFNAQTYTLAGADVPATAYFVAGSFVGVDYLDQDSFGTAVQLTSGFSELSEALFSYQPTGAAQGLGGFTSFTAGGTVPEPAPLALVVVAAAAGLRAQVQARRKSAGSFA